MFSIIDPCCLTNLLSNVTYVILCSVFSIHSVVVFSHISYIAVVVSNSQILTSRRQQCSLHVTQRANQLTSTIYNQIFMTTIRWLLSYFLYMQRLTFHHVEQLIVRPRAAASINDRHRWWQRRPSLSPSCRRPLHLSHTRFAPTRPTTYRQRWQRPEQPVTIMAHFCKYVFPLKSTLLIAYTTRDCNPTNHVFATLRLDNFVGCP